jgi:hypothetical protein
MKQVMKKKTIIRKIENAFLAYLILALYSVNAMEKDEMVVPAHSGKIHAEVQRILRKFQNDMNAYYERTGNSKRVQIASDETAAKDAEQAEVHLIPSPPAASPNNFERIQSNFKVYQANPTPQLRRQIAEDLKSFIKSKRLKDSDKEEANKIAKAIDDKYLNEIRSDFVAYQDKLDRSLKHKIVVALNGLMLSKELKDGDKKEAIVIATGIESHNLQARLGAYHQEGPGKDRGMGSINPLPSELIEQIIKMILEEGSIKDTGLCS